MIYVQVYNDCGLKIDEIEIEDDDNVSEALATACSDYWVLDPGDTIKITKE